MSHFYQEQFMLCLVAGVYILMECKAGIRLNYICSLSLAQKQSASTYCFPIGSVLPYNLYIYIHRNTVPLMYILLYMLFYVHQIYPHFNNNWIILPRELNMYFQDIFRNYRRHCKQSVSFLNYFLWIGGCLLIILSQLIKMKNLWEI